MPAIDAVLDDLVKRGGTDLHLAVHQPPIGRVRGDLVPLREPPLSARDLEEMLLELITPAQRARLASELDLDLAYVHKNGARFRVSLFVKHSGIAASFRLVPARVPTLSELGAPEVLARLAEQRSGLLVVAGPAANGKTTTTAAVVDHVNRTRACHILTLESPIEFVHEPARAQIIQREVGTHLPSLAVGLRNAARENADVVVVSDLGAKEDIELAIRLASDGVAVILNVPASSAVSTVERLLGCFEEEAQHRLRGRLAESLTGVVVQHLVRAADSYGRLPVYEILVGTPATRALIHEGRVAALGDTMRSELHGMQTLDAGLERLLNGRRITPEMAFERSIDKASFAEVIARVRPDLVDVTPPS